MGGRGSRIGNASGSIPMPGLVGTERQVAWAEEIRARIKDAAEELVRLESEWMKHPDHIDLSLYQQEKMAIDARRATLFGKDESYRQQQKQVLDEHGIGVGRVSRQVIQERRGRMTDSEYRDFANKARAKANRQMHEWVKKEIQSIFSNREAKYWIDKYK